MSMEVRRPAMFMFVGFMFLGLCTVGWSGALVPLWNPTSGPYEHRDPAAHGGVWERESLLEKQKPSAACFCQGQVVSGRGTDTDLTWEGFLTDLQRSLEEDRLFEGHWVHGLCARIYPVFFRVVGLDPETGQLLPPIVPCSAGLMSMALVCVQSIALTATAAAAPVHERSASVQEPSSTSRSSSGPSSSWKWTARPVKEEGRSLGDFLGRVPIAECLRLCEERMGCASLAHGPHGCHLKDRCVSSSEELIQSGHSPPGYRTYYRLGSAPCNGEVPDPGPGPGPGPPEAASAAEPRTDEVRLLLDAALQLLERAAHCLDSSPWPFTVAEVLENRLDFVEAQLHLHAQAAEAAQRQGPSGGEGGSPSQKTRLWSFGFRWSRPRVQRSLGFGGLTQGDEKGTAAQSPVQRTLDRLHIRWVRGLDSEVGFWHALLDPAARDAPDVDPKAWASAQRWLSSGNVSWHLGDICDYLSSARPSTESYGPPRVLNVGSGPLAARAIECGGEEVPVASADGLARFYMQLYDVLGHKPPALPAQCAAEVLHTCFPRHHFDVVHIRNALDHAGDPLLGLEQMLEVVRPGGWVLLRHARNEGVPGHFQLGLHQWAFDVLPSPEGARFAVWNPALQADATAWLLNAGLAAEVRVELRPPPRGEAEAEVEAKAAAADADERYVYVELRKPI